MTENVKNKIHTARFKDLDQEQDKFINARVTTPQTYGEIKNKGTATILKIASKGIVEKLLQRCEYYKTIITKKTETIKSKNELIGLLAARLQQHEPELFKQDLKELAEQVEQAKSEEVKTGIENEKTTELTDQEQQKVKTDNDNLDIDEDIDTDEIDREPEREPEPDREPGITKCDNCGEEYEDDSDHECRDIDDGEERGSECGEGGDGPDIDDIDETEEDIEKKED